MNKQNDLEQSFRHILYNNCAISFILKKAGRLFNCPWYLTGSSLAQTIWNYQYDVDPETGITDYDLVYYDSSDISYNAEDVIIKRGEELFVTIDKEVQIRNQARVHLWYNTGKRSGEGRLPLQQFKNIEEAIAGNPTNCSSIGMGKDDQLFAPYGLQDIFDMIVRPNKKRAPKHVYETKTNRWKHIWNDLLIVPWDTQ